MNYEYYRSLWLSRYTSSEADCIRSCEKRRTVRRGAFKVLFVRRTTSSRRNKNPPPHPKFLKRFFLLGTRKLKLSVIPM